MTNHVILPMDARLALPLMAEQSVHTCVTSPPYFGLRNYGHDDQIGLEPTPDGFVASLVEVFREVRRVLRDDGTVWLNLGDSYVTTPAGNKTPTGFSQGSKKRQGKLESYNSTKKSFGLPHKSLIGIPWRVALALQADGWLLRQDIIWSKPHPTQESAKDRCTRSHEYIFMFSKKPRYFYDQDAIREPVKASNTGVVNGGNGKTYAEIKGANKRTVWTVGKEGFPGAHFATFPPDLIEPCVLAGCPEGGTVLDPFGGAGTTGLVAKRNGRNSVLCEINPEYADMAEARIAAG